MVTIEFIFCFLLATLIWPKIGTLGVPEVVLQIAGFLSLLGVAILVTLAKKGILNPASAGFRVPYVINSAIAAVGLMGSPPQAYGAVALQLFFVLTGTIEFLPKQKNK